MDQLQSLLRMEYDWNWNGARSDLERALAIAPSDPLAHKFYGTLLACLGRGADAIRLQRRAVELDPLLFTNWAWLGYTYISQGQHALGRSAIQRALELSNFKKDDLLWTMAWSYLLEGNLALAVAWSEKLKDEDDRLWASAAIEHARGHRMEAQAALEKLIAKVGSTAPFGIAEHYAWRGEVDRAFEWLERAYAARDDSLNSIKVEASFNSLRGDPRYVVLLKRMNLPPD